MGCIFDGTVKTGPEADRSLHRRRLRATDTRGRSRPSRGSEQARRLSAWATAQVTIRTEMGRNFCVLKTCDRVHCLGLEQGTSRGGGNPLGGLRDSWAHPAPIHRLPFVVCFKQMVAYFFPVYTWGPQPSVQADPALGTHRLLSGGRGWHDPPPPSLGRVASGWLVSRAALGQEPAGGAGPGPSSPALSDGQPSPASSSRGAALPPGVHSSWVLGCLEEPRGGQGAASRSEAGAELGRG